MNRRTLTTSMLAATATSIALPGPLRAQTPSTSPATMSGIRLADVPGAPIALSPDGTMLAGTLDGERFGTWDTETLETIARSEPMRELRLLDAPSITWSPDSSAVAWSLDATRSMRDSDIYAFDLDTGSITNLTDEDPEGDDVPTIPVGESDMQVMNIDMYPSWSADGTSLVVARTVWDGARELQTGLWRIPREGGEATPIVPVAPYPMHISSIRAGSEDESVLYTTWTLPGSDPADPHHGLFLATPDGEVERVSTGMLASATPAMLLLSVEAGARKASLVSAMNYGMLDNPEGPVWIEMDLDTGIPTAFDEVLSLPTDYIEAIRQDMILLAAPAFLTDPQGSVTGYVYATTNADYDTFTLWRYDAASGEAESLGTFSPEEAEPRSVRHYSRIEVGANDIVALFHGGNAWLATT